MADAGKCCKLLIFARITDRINRNFLKFPEITGDCRRLRYILENIGSNPRVMADMLENAGDCHCLPELFIIQDQYGKMTVFIRMCQNFHRFFSFDQ